MRRKVGLTTVVIAAAALALAGCSALHKQETTASSIPSAETLRAACAAGAAQTPPIRAGACDDFNMVQAGCIALSQQTVVPGQALQVCTAGGYVLSGNWTRL